MTDDNPFFGIDRAEGSIWPTLADVKPQCLTRALLEEAIEYERTRAQAPLPMEFHHPECPKLLTNGSKACRCGTAPLEAVFEDELTKGKQ